MSTLQMSHDSDQCGTSTDGGESHNGMADFEISERRALCRILMLQIGISKGCGFHFYQALVRQLGKKGLITQEADVGVEERDPRF